MQLSATHLATARQDISVVFSLMGGTASAFVCYIIPSLVGYKLNVRLPQNRTRAGRVAVVGLGVFGLLIGVLSTSTTIAGLFQPQPPTFDPCNATAVA